MAIYSFIAEEKADVRSKWSVAQMCRVLDVARSGFYVWEKNKPCRRDVDDDALAVEIEMVWVCSGCTYGSPRMHAWLRKQGFRVSRKRVARIMRKHGFVGVCGNTPAPRTTVVDKAAKVSRDLVNRNFSPTAPNDTYVGDITYVRTGEGFAYLATVIDLYSRRVIGWAIDDHLRAGLVCDALDMAAIIRGESIRGAKFHSDRGCQYTSGEYKALCTKLGITQSMGATGVCWDNAVAESFFATLKKEHVYRRRFATIAQARHQIALWIESWYNTRRLHSTLGYRTPTETEHDYQTSKKAA